MSEYTDNPVYKLMMDKLQLVLINVVIRSLGQRVCQKQHRIGMI